MLKHVIERQQPPRQHFPGGDPAATEVPGAERPVDPARGSGTRGRCRIRRPVLLDGQALPDEGAYGAPCFLDVAPQEARPLRAGEDAPVEIGQGDPFGPAARPAEGLPPPSPVP